MKAIASKRISSFACVSLFFAGPLLSSMADAQTLTPVEEWLLAGCQVGQEGQSEAALTQYGTNAVPALILAAQNGPAPGQIAQREAGTSAAYDAVQGVLATDGLAGADPGDVAAVQAESRGEFVAADSAAFARNYRIRALQGLGIVGGSSAVAALQAFAAASTDPELKQVALDAVPNAAAADVNQDGSINCADLAIVKASLGKRLGQRGFDPRADVNRDGVVDRADIQLVKQALAAGSRCRDEDDRDGDRRGGPGNRDTGKGDHGDDESR